MRGRDLVFVGDSTIGKTVHSLIRLVLQTPTELINSMTHPWPPYEVADCPSPTPKFTIKYVRNDHLLLNELDIELAKAHAKRVNRRDLFFPFASVLSDHMVLVLNRGAHFSPTERLTRELGGLLSLVTQTYPQAQVLYQHTVMPVHASLFSIVPATRPLPLVQDNNTKEYHWIELPQQNRDVQKFLQREFPRVVNLNPQYMMSFRGDGRLDSLHSCVPGWTDWTVVLLAHALIHLEET